jgi:hypothetical protein
MRPDDPGSPNLVVFVAEHSLYVSTVVKAEGILTSTVRAKMLVTLGACSPTEA